MTRAEDNTVDNNEIATAYNILDIYAKRMDRNLWMPDIFNESHFESIINTNLFTFASLFKSYIKGNNKNKIDYHYGHEKAILYSHLHIRQTPKVRIIIYTAITL